MAPRHRAILLGSQRSPSSTRAEGSEGHPRRTRLWGSKTLITLATRAFGQSRGADRGAPISPRSRVGAWPRAAQRPVRSESDALKSCWSSLDPGHGPSDWPGSLRQHAEGLPAPSHREGYLEACLSPNFPVNGVIGVFDPHRFSLRSLTISSSSASGTRCGLVRGRRDLGSSPASPSAWNRRTSSCTHRLDTP